MTSPAVRLISEAEQRRRAAAVAESVHSAALEGGTVSAETLADSEAYVRGEYDERELLRRTRSRYGLA